MSLSDAEIHDVVRELAQDLPGGTVDKVYVRDDHTLVIEIGRARLLLSTHPRASRLQLETTRPPAGAPPPAFAMLLRKRIGGLRLHAIAATPDERIVTLDFGPAHDRVVAELTGPHSNVFLLAPDGAVVSSFHHPRSATRLLAPGSPYTIPTTAPADARWRGRRRFASMADMAAFYDAELRASEETALRERARGLLRRELTKVERRERALTGDLDRVTEAALFRKFGDLLLAHAHALPGRGASSATVPDDFTDGTPLTFPLDPALDVRANATRYYKKHKRLTAGRKHVDARLKQTRAEHATLLERILRLEHLSLDELRQLVPAAPSAKTARRRAAEPVERLPYKEYRSLSGDAIWVGRSAKDNDSLTFHHARGGDLWLHTRDAPGSHVIIPLRGKPLSEATFLDAATLAAHASPLSDESQVDVTYTHVKNLRKPKGAAPGLVYVADGKTLRVRLEPARLARLLAELRT